MQVQEKKEKFSLTTSKQATSANWWRRCYPANYQESRILGDQRFECQQQVCIRAKVEELLSKGYENDSLMKTITLEDWSDQ